jgi:class 3 adenylate cyclase
LEGLTFAPISCNCLSNSIPYDLALGYAPSSVSDHGRIDAGETVKHRLRASLTLRQRAAGPGAGGRVMATARTERRLAAIMAADIVGYSRLVEADEAGTLNAIRDLP